MWWIKYYPDNPYSTPPFSLFHYSICTYKNWVIQNYLAITVCGGSFWLTAVTFRGSSPCSRTHNFRSSNLASTLSSTQWHIMYTSIANVVLICLIFLSLSYKNILWNALLLTANFLFTNIKNTQNIYLYIHIRALFIS